jgi:GT2 family glycosyltransferase
LDSGAADFAGPVTNAPGHCPHQNVVNWLPDYELSDAERSLTATAARLSMAFAGVVEPAAKLNGFCIAARTSAFWQYAFDRKSAFDPAIRLAGNEDAFFRRAQGRGARLAVLPSSFVFHYRSVTRGRLDTRLARGAYR